MPRPALPPGVIVGVVAGALFAGCITRWLAPERRLTGTCDGACAYYLGCKHADGPDARAACVVDCGGVFGSPEQIRAFESLSCRDVVEFVDGIPPASVPVAR
ncbi:MAG: hypothetical protein R2939_01720 [Kofleriaceae bacterium]